MRVPDLISPIIAWRVWQWDAAGLKSLNGETWLPRKRLQARCRDNATCRFHEAPQFTCTCGIYASKILDHLRRTRSWQHGGVHGQVSLWGSVVEHEQGFRAEFGYPQRLYLPFDTLPVTLKEIEFRIRTLTEYGCDISIAADASTIPLWHKTSGLDAAGLDFLMRRGRKWYAQRKQERTLKPGDRMSVLGLGIAVVEQIDDKHVHSVLWNRSKLTFRRKQILWNGSNMRWEVRMQACVGALALR